MENEEAALPASREIEAKFLLQSADQFDTFWNHLRSKGIPLEQAPAQVILDRYFDTDDWRLFRAGWAYRWQKVNGEHRVCLKSLTRADSAVQEREEVEESVLRFPLTPGDPPEGALGEKLRDALGGQAPKELFRVSKMRQRHIIRIEEGTRIELDLDTASVTSSVRPKNAFPGEIQFHELELELLEGDPLRLYELAGEMEEKLGFLPARLSKFERGLQAGGLRPPSPRQEAFGQELCLETPVAVLAYQSLSRQFDDLLAFEGGTWEGLEPEALHQMRVASRRLRAALKVFRDFLPVREGQSLNRSFRWIAGVLGEVRDLDVYAENFDRYSQAISTEDRECLAAYVRDLESQRRRARKKLLTALSSRRYQRLVERTGRFLDKGPAKSLLQGDRARPIAEVGHDLIEGRLKKFLRRGREIGEHPKPQQLHDLRIHCKRLRYSLEFYLPVYGDGGLGPLIKKLKRLQSLLGDHQDACIASERLRAFSARAPLRGGTARGLLLSLGQLVHAQDQIAAGLRGEFQGAWANLDQKGLRQKIQKTLHPRGHTFHD